MGTSLNNPKASAEKGEEIYAQKFKEEYEEKFLGKYVAVDVTTETAHVSDTPEGALKKAQDMNPGGVYHLMKVGSQGAFRVSYTSNANSNWVFQ